MEQEEVHLSEQTFKVVNEGNTYGIDIVEKSIGVLGRWQIWISIAICLVKFPVVWHQLIIMFLAPPVNFTCIDTNVDRCSPNCTGHTFDRTTFSETIITQWNLVCDQAYLANLAQTITMLGILFGNILFGFLSDRFGRRNPFIGAVVLQIISGSSAAFSQWLPFFLILRFLSALATGGTMVTSFVLVMELIGTKWRTTVGILYQIPFNVGHLCLPLIAYFIRDWRYLQLTISIIPVILVSYYWILPESPRWLLTAGRTEEAINTLEGAARYNKLPTENIREDIENYVEKKDFVENSQGGNIIDLVRTPIMRKYTFCVGFNWLVCGLCFFGVAQYIGQLGGNIFVNVAFSAIIQIPGTFFSIWALKTWGRRYSLIFANVLAGSCCIIITFIPFNLVWAKSALSCVGMFALSISFATIYIYSGELFPTMHRNIGVGISSMFARIGSMGAPFITSLAAIRLWLPPIIFGVFPLIGAILCLKLPETLNCKLPDTVKEAESFVKRRLNSQHKSETTPLS